MLNEAKHERSEASPPTQAGVFEWFSPQNDIT